MSADCFSQGSHRAQTVLISVKIPVLSILTPYRQFIFSALLKRTDGIIGRCVAREQTRCVIQTASVHSVRFVQSVNGGRFKLDILLS